MTVYERLCCFKSPNWCNYQNLLDPAYDYILPKIERNLPPTVTDSYLGRLVAIATEVNTRLDDLTFDTLGSFSECVAIFNQSGVLWGRAFNAKMYQKIKTFLSMGFPASWLKSLLQVYLLEFGSKNGPTIDLNDPKFLPILEKLSKCSYPAVVRWFDAHPEGASSKTVYEGC